MLRKWILQVGSAPPSALTSPAHPPTWLVSKHWGRAKSPAQQHAMLLLGLLPMPVSVQMCILPMTKDEEHSMCQNSTRVIFNIFIFILITIVIPEWTGFVLGAIFVYADDQNVQC